MFQQNPSGPTQEQTPSVFYTTPSNPFGTPTSLSLFGTPNTSAFGTVSSIPTFGVSVAFGALTTPVFGASSAPAFTPAFTASITPAFGSLPTPAYGATSFSFGFSFPVFGQSASTFGSPFGAQISPFEAHATAPNIGSSISGQPYQQHVGSIQPAEKLESISATHTYDEKSYEELRWKDYQPGDKGGQTSNHFRPAQSQNPSLFRVISPFGPPSPFGTSNSGTSSSIFGHCTSPSFGFSTPIGTKNTSPSGTSTTPGFGARTLPSPLDTPNTPTSVSGSTPRLGATMSPSPFSSEISIGTQSTSLFQSSSSDPGQKSSPLAQTGLASEQSTSAVISQSDASKGTFSFSTSSQFAQLTQNPASSHLAETTGGTGSASNVSTVVDQAAS